MKKDRCVLGGYEGKCESLCYICQHNDVCAVPLSKISLWVNYCYNCKVDEHEIDKMVIMKLIKKKKE